MIDRNKFVNRISEIVEKTRNKFINDIKGQINERKFICYPSMTENNIHMQTK